MTGFARTLVFGALASATLPLSVLLWSPVVGVASALGLHAVFSAAGYLAVLSSGLRRRVAVACASAAAGLLLLALLGSAWQLLVCLSIGVGVVRSGLLFRRGNPLRAIVIEGAVLVGALLAAGFLASPGLVGNAIALWGWFVVQSFAFVLGSITRRQPQHLGDPFDLARDRLLELLGPEPLRRP